MIVLETSKGFQVKHLQPGEEPKADFAVVPGEEPVAVYEYCNLHGLWTVSYTHLPSASRLRFGPVGASPGPKGLYRAITASLLRGAVYSSLSYTTKEGLFVQDLPNGFTGFANKAKEQNTNPLDALLRAEHKEPKEDNTPTRCV